MGSVPNRQKTAVHDCIFSSLLSKTLHWQSITSVRTKKMQPPEKKKTRGHKEEGKFASLEEDVTTVLASYETLPEAMQLLSVNRAVNQRRVAVLQTRDVWDLETEPQLRRLFVERPDEFDRLVFGVPKGDQQTVPTSMVKLVLPVCRREWAGWTLLLASGFKYLRVLELMPDDNRSIATPMLPWYLDQLWEHRSGIQLEQLVIRMHLMNGQPGAETKTAIQLLTDAKFVQGLRLLELTLPFALPPSLFESALPLWTSLRHLKLQVEWTSAFVASIVQHLGRRLETCHLSSHKTPDNPREAWLCNPDTLEYVFRECKQLQKLRLGGHQRQGPLTIWQTEGEWNASVRHCSVADHMDAEMYEIPLPRCVEQDLQLLHATGIRRWRSLTLVDYLHQDIYSFLVERRTEPSTSQVLQLVHTWRVESLVLTLSFAQKRNGLLENDVMIHFTNMFAEPVRQFTVLDDTNHTALRLDAKTGACTLDPTQFNDDDGALLNPVQHVFDVVWQQPILDYCVTDGRNMFMMIAKPQHLKSLDVPFDIKSDIGTLINTCPALQHLWLRDWPSYMHPYTLLKFHNLLTLHLIFRHGAREIREYEYKDPIDVVTLQKLLRQNPKLTDLSLALLRCQILYPAQILDDMKLTEVANWHTLGLPFSGAGVRHRDVLELLTKCPALRALTFIDDGVPQGSTLDEYDIKQHMWERVKLPLRTAFEDHAPCTRWQEEALREYALQRHKVALDFRGWPYLVQAEDEDTDTISMLERFLQECPPTIEESKWQPGHPRRTAKEEEVRFIESILPSSAIRHIENVPAWTVMETTQWSIFVLQTAGVSHSELEQPNVVLLADHTLRTIELVPSWTLLSGDHSYRNINNVCTGYLNVFDYVKESQVPVKRIHGYGVKEPWSYLHPAMFRGIMDWRYIQRTTLAGLYIALRTRFASGVPNNVLVWWMLHGASWRNRIAKLVSCAPSLPSWSVLPQHMETKKDPASAGSRLDKSTPASADNHPPASAGNRLDKSQEIVQRSIQHSVRVWFDEDGSQLVDAIEQGRDWSNASLEYIHAMGTLTIFSSGTMVEIDQLHRLIESLGLEAYGIQIEVRPR
jgi:hypothetical protein